MYDWGLNLILFLVSKVTRKEGDNVTITWNAPYFPSSGIYNVYHTNEGNITSVITIVGDAEKGTPQNEKYEYLSKPLNSTNITFMIRDITLDDAGYYTSGTKEEDARSGGGVVLIVLGELF